MEEARFVLLIFVGLVAGASSGLLGIGGGIVMVPALMAWAGLDFLEAVAASLAVMVAVTPVGVWRHARAGNVELSRGLWLGAGGIIGVAVASATQHLIPLRAFVLLFTGVLVAGAYDVVRRTSARTLRKPRESAGFGPALLMGVLAGVAAKWLGIGGGILLVPALVVGGLSIHAAVGTSLVAVWTNAVAATAINVRIGFAWWPAAMALAVGSIGGVYVGAFAAIRARTRVLGRVFAGALLLAALYMGSRAV